MAREHGEGGPLPARCDAVPLGERLAHALLQELARDLQLTPLGQARGALRASFSCGVAAIPAYLTGSSLIEAADEALLQAKRDGRNRIVASGVKRQAARA